MSWKNPHQSLSLFSWLPSVQTASAIAASGAIRTECRSYSALDPQHEFSHLLLAGAKAGTAHATLALAFSGIGPLLADSYTAAFAPKRLERRAMEERAPGIVAP